MIRPTLFAAALGAALLLHSGHAAFTLDATRAELVTSTGRAPLSSADGLFDRVFIAEKSTIRLHLALPALLPGHEVSITAPNGGKLARIGGEKMNFTPRAAGPLDLDLEFTPSLGRGAYTITIRQAGAVLTLDLWAGAPNPIGQPGPAYVPARNPEGDTVP